MFACFETIVESQAAESASTFKSYSKLVVAAAKADGQLDAKDLSQMRRVLTALKRPIEQANTDVANLIELDRAVQLAAIQREAEAEYLDATGRHDAVQLDARTQRERVEAGKRAKQQAGLLSVGAFDQYEREIAAINENERRQLAGTSPAVNAAIAKLNQARAAAELVKNIKARIAPILAALDSGPVGID